MAGEDILGYSGTAAVAYKDALDQARITQNALLRQYGFTLPGADGAYSVGGAQSAFDPTKLFKDGRVDLARVEELAKGLQYGPSGRISDVASAGVSGEADVISEVRGRGFGGEIGGGLMNQRRGLAETMAGRQMGQAKAEFLSGIGEALSPIGGAYETLQKGMISDTADTEAGRAFRETINQPVTDEASSVSSKPPTNARNYQRWTDAKTGQKFQFVNKKWKKI